jgi:hypothetical protein
VITRHFQHLPCMVDIHMVVDDFGNVVRDSASANMLKPHVWWNAYRFANVVSFEQAGMRSLYQAVSEH